MLRQKKSLNTVWLCCNFRQEVLNEHLDHFYSFCTFDTIINRYCFILCGIEKYQSVDTFGSFTQQTLVCGMMLFLRSISNWYCTKPPLCFLSWQQPVSIFITHLPLDLVLSLQSSIKSEEENKSYVIRANAIFAATDIQLSSTQLRLLFYMYQLSLLQACVRMCAKCNTPRRLPKHFWPGLCLLHKQHLFLPTNESDIIGALQAS